MADPFASGNWKVTEGKEEEFVERWTDFLRWTRDTQPALVSASLLRDQGNGTHFVSFAQWSDEAARNAWKQSDGFRERVGACLALCEDMSGADYDRVVTI